MSLSAAKAISVLRVVAAATAPISVTEIVAQTGLKKTIALRMLATLHEERLVERDLATGRYRLGLGLVAMAQTAIRKHPLSLQVDNIIGEIVETTKDTVLVMVQDGVQAMCIDRRVGAAPISTTGTNIGTRAPLHCGGAPFALLAFSPDAFVEAYLAEPLAVRTPVTETDPAKLWERIHEARKRGYTIGREDLFQYVVAIGVPVLSAEGVLLGSLSVGSVTQRYPEERCHEVGRFLRELTQQKIVSTKQEVMP